MKIAVIGGGISGLSCAWRLGRDHDVTLYEANRYVGGHTNTVTATVDGVSYPVDTGFLVYNERTYPNLIQLFAELGVATTPSEMSFSVGLIRAGVVGLEWAGTDLNSVFTQRRNLVNPRFLRMLADIVRFNRLARALSRADDDQLRSMTLGEFLARERFSKSFRDWYLLPMAAAIWSCSTAQMTAYPLSTFVKFCDNHGLLQIANRPRWFTVQGGAKEYVKKLLAAIRQVRVADAAVRVARDPALGGKVVIRGQHDSAVYDRVVLACHSDQALALLDDPSSDEAKLLGAIRYQPNEAVLHTDQSLLPRSQKAWAAWNYQRHITEQGSGEARVCVHYLINRLQPVPFQRPVVVSLNPAVAPRPETVLGQYDYAHPLFDRAALAAQERLPGIQGQRNTWYAGAWTGYGFHEDGLKSGLAAAESILSEARLSSARAA